MKKLLRRFINTLFSTPQVNKTENGFIGPNCTIQDVTFGIHNKIGPGCYLYNSFVGDYTFLAQNVTVMNTRIGKFCSIAQGAAICLGKHPSATFVSTHPAFFSTHKQNGMMFTDQTYFDEMGKTTIGNDVWIGVNAVIMDDVTVGDGAIIGAGAVVTKDIPPYAIAVGTPAKVIRHRFEKEEIDFLSDFKWWDKDESWLKEHFKDLHDIKSFIKKHA